MGVPRNRSKLADRAAARPFASRPSFRIRSSPDRVRPARNREVERVGRIEEAADTDRPGGEVSDGRLVTRQQALPIPWQLIRAADEFDERDFAHPAEVDFSRILSFYRIRWSYEPTTFPLAYSDEGRPSEMFTPDFYLPEHKLYIEVTTMRQRLVTRKNRKIRRLRELYPNVRIKLLYRRDCDRLGDAYRPAKPDAAAYRVGRVVFDEERIRERIADLASAIAGSSDEAPPVSGNEPTPFLMSLPIWEQIDASEASAPSFGAEVETDDRSSLLVLGVDRGSAVFAHHLAAELERIGMGIDRDRVTLTRHRSPMGERRVRIGRAPRTPVAGRRVLLVADVVSTGLSLAYLTWWLRQRGARQIEICTLLDRQAARLVEVPLRYVGFEAPNELLVGFGLHLRRQFRHLPYIASLVTESVGDGTS
jgi:hypoxanthine phosphoribosyltransferase